MGGGLEDASVRRLAVRRGPAQDLREGDPGCPRVCGCFSTPWHSPLQPRGRRAGCHRRRTERRVSDAARAATRRRQASRGDSTIIAGRDRARLARHVPPKAGFASNALCAA